MTPQDRQFQKLKVLDLFSGIGGFSLGLERTGGFETVAFCEIEEYPQKILKKQWPDVPIYNDVRTLDYDGPVDVICGGFPCQNISIAGAAWGVRHGLDGDRSGLWFDMLRLIDKFRPTFVIIENVAALLSEGLITILQGLGSIWYDAEWHAIPASALGSIQNRDRVWIIAYPGGQRVQGLLEGIDIGKFGQGRTCSPKDLQQIYASPLNQDRWPQPIICGGRRQFPNWVDRIKSLGNSVDPAIPEMIGYYILEAVQ